MEILRLVKIQILLVFTFPGYMRFFSFAGKMDVSLL